MTRVALVTGGARRIGAAICRSFHDAGYNLVIHYNTSDIDARALAAEFNTQRSCSAVVCQANMAEQGWLQLATEALGAFSRIDVLVNNASSFFSTPSSNSSIGDWETLMNTNVRFPFFLSHALAAELKQNRGQIINIIDIFAERPLANHGIYSISKAAFAMATRSLALELAPEVRVNGISPGIILWPEQGHLDEKSMIMNLPLEEEGSPEDIAAAVKFLCQDGGYITGQILAVDGGKSLIQG